MAHVSRFCCWNRCFWGSYLVVYVCCFYDLNFSESCTRSVLCIFFCLLLFVAACLLYIWRVWDTAYCHKAVLQTLSVANCCLSIVFLLVVLLSFCCRLSFVSVWVCRVCSLCQVCFSHVSFARLLSRAFSYAWSSFSAGGRSIPSFHRQITQNCSICTSEVVVQQLDAYYTRCPMCDWPWWCPTYTRRPLRAAVTNKTASRHQHFLRMSLVFSHPFATRQIRLDSRCWCPIYVLSRSEISVHRMDISSR